jgi:hypothetical protein
VEEYDVCMRKIERVSIPWITTTIDLEKITMDFIEVLLHSRGKDATFRRNLEKYNHEFYRSTATFRRKRCNIQIVDMFTKYKHFIAVTPPFSAQEITKLF